MADQQNTKRSEPAVTGGLSELLSSGGPLAAFGELLGGARRGLESAPREGTAGGGLVRLTLAGDGRLTQLQIDPAVFASGDAGDLQDLVLAAFANAFEAVQQEKQRQLFALAGLDQAVPSALAEGGGRDS